MILLGFAMKQSRMVDDVFFKTSDRLIYYFLFPCMLFWKIGGGRNGAAIDWPLVLAAVCASGVVFVLSTAFIPLFKVPQFKAGSFSQTCYRFNTYIGMAVLLNAVGEEGVRGLGVLAGFLIPLINVMAVSVLIWYSGKDYSIRRRAVLTGKALISNPLIIACLAGILYASVGPPFPAFVENSLRLVSAPTLPMALLSIGAALTFTEVKSHFKLSVVGAVFKLVLMPVIGYGFLRWFQVTGISFKVGMVFFTTPTSTAIHVLSAQLNSDTKLASASVMLSIVLSFFTLTLALAM